MGHHILAKLKNASTEDWLLFFSLFSCLFLVRNYMNMDAWFILNCGRYVDMNGIPHIDPFTFHDNLHYVMQQWLFALAIWKAYSFFGMNAMLVYPYLSSVFVVLAEASLVWAVAGKNRFVSACMTIPVCGVFCLMFATQRPWTVSLAAFAFELFLLEYFRKDGNLRIVSVLFFLLSVLCVNIQSAMWPMLVVLLLPYIADSLFKTRLSRFVPCEEGWKTKSLLALLLVIVIGGFVNPYGMEGMGYAFTTYGKPSINESITEMFRLSADNPFSSGMILLILVAVAFYARHPVPLRFLCLSAGTAFMSFLAVRNTAFFLFFGLLGIAYHYKAWIPSCRIHKSTIVACSVLAALLLLSSWELIFDSFSAHPLATAAFIAIPLFCAAVFREHRWFCALSLILLACAPKFLVALQVPLVDPALVESVRTIQEDDKHADIVSDFTDGGYAEFMGLRCYDDGRADALIKEANWKKDYIKERTELRNGALDYKEFFARYPKVTHVISHGEDLLFVYLMNDPDFELVYDSGKPDNRYQDESSFYKLGYGNEEYRVFRRK